VELRTFPKRKRKRLERDETKKAESGNIKCAQRKGGGGPGKTPDYLYFQGGSERVGGGRTRELISSMQGIGARLEGLRPL